MVTSGSETWRPAKGENNFKLELGLNKLRLGKPVCPCVLGNQEMPISGHPHEDKKYTNIKLVNF